MSLLVPSMRGVIGSATAGGTPLPSIGTRVFSWSSDGEFGSCWADEACTVPAALGGRVAAIKSSEGAILSQPDAPQRPLLQPASQNALPGLFFSDSRDDFLKSENTTFLNAIRALTALTLLLVWKVAPHPGTDTGICFNRPGSDGGLKVTKSGGGDDTNGGRAGAGDTYASYHAAANISAAYAAVISFDGLGGTPKQTRLYAQAVGNVDAVDTDPSEGGVWSHATMGARKAGTGHADFLTGTIYELLIFDAAADNTAVTDLFSYATAKWALP